MDVSGMSRGELQELIGTATAAYQARVAEEQADQVRRRDRIVAAITGLEALIGPEDTAPYDPVTGENATINGVLKHDTEDHAILAANAGLAISLILHGLRVNTATVLDIARVISAD